MKCRYCGSDNVSHIENKHEDATSAVFGSLGLDPEIHSFESFACGECHQITQINKKQLREMQETVVEQPQTPIQNETNTTEQPTPDFSQ